MAATKRAYANANPSDTVAESVAVKMETLSVNEQANLITAQAAMDAAIAAE